MAYKPMFGSRHRENIWLRECFNAYAASRTDGSCPICNLCDEPVTRVQADTDGWHESHAPERAKSFGGKSVGVAHAACNLEHGRKVVVPMLARSNRVIARYNGTKGPGMGRYPMRAGRRSPITKTLHHGVQPRLSLADRHARAMAALRIVPIEAPELVPADLIPAERP